jgi:hypothetical protein
VIAAAAAWLAVAVAKQPRAANRLPHLAANRLRPANPIPAVVVDVKVYSLASKPVVALARRIVANLLLAVVAYKVAPAVVQTPLLKRLKKRLKKLLKLLKLLKHRFAP